MKCFHQLDIMLNLKLELEDVFSSSSDSGEKNTVFSHMNLLNNLYKLLSKIMS